MKTINFIIFFTLFFTSVVKADIHTDLTALNSNTQSLNSELTNLSMDQNASCSTLGSLNQGIQALTADMELIIASMSTFSVTTSDLDSLDSVSALIRNMSLEAVRLSNELMLIQTTTELFEYRAALSAMLQLSSDIGDMADRIIITQQLQSANLALTQASILTTMENMVVLSDTFSSLAYNTPLSSIITQSNILTSTMGNLTLTSTNMSSELENLAVSI
jgi:phosphatidylserine/phosphatidylglycerophosphate/cardiolipin synthase-like enzyme